MPSATSTTAPVAIPGTAAIRAGIVLLGATGFALSYDALRQMALATHIRGPLTYAFPLVIDGFIAIGVAVLLILRTAPLHSRLYVWALVGIATATSIWANALHAIRLNQQATPTGLHLDDLTVGALSAIAPLALAGAIHLYLVIRRHAGPHPNGPAPEPAANRHIAEPAPRRQPSPAADRHQPPRPAPQSGTDVAESATTVAEVPENPTKSKGRQPSATMDELLTIGRTAPQGRDGRISRRAVEAAIRAKGHTIGKDRLTEATRLLQAERDTTPADAM